MPIYRFKLYIIYNVISCNVRPILSWHNVAHTSVIRVRRPADVFRGKFDFHFAFKTATLYSRIRLNRINIRLDETAIVCCRVLDVGGARQRHDCTVTNVRHRSDPSRQTGTVYTLSRKPKPFRQTKYRTNARLIRRLDESRPILSRTGESRPCRETSSAKDVKNKYRLASVLLILRSDAYSHCRRCQDSNMNIIYHCAINKSVYLL